MIYLKVKKDPQEEEIISVEKFPFTIGRSLRNSLVVSDESISASHAQIIQTEAGGYQLQDLGSTNGIGYEGQRYPHLALENGKVFSLGSVEFEFYTEDPPLEKTREIDLTPLHWSSQGPVSKGRWIINSLCVVWIIVCFGSDFFLNSYDDSLDDYLLSALLTLLGGFVIALLIALFSKLHSKQYRYAMILQPILCGVGTLLTYGVLRDLLFFNIDIPILLGISEFIFFVLLFYGVAFQLTRAIFHEKTTRQISIFIGVLTLSVVLLASSVSLLANLKDQEYRFYGVIHYPLVSFLTPSRQMQDFFDKMDESQEKLERYRLKQILEEKHSSP